jgi:hypothetical protein
MAESLSHMRRQAQRQHNFWAQLFQKGLVSFFLSSPFFSFSSPAFPLLLFFSFFTSPSLLLLLCFFFTSPSLLLLLYFPFSLFPFRRIRNTLCSSPSSFFAFPLLPPLSPSCPPLFLLLYEDIEEWMFSSEKDQKHIVFHSWDIHLNLLSSK